MSNNSATTNHKLF